MVWEGKGRQPRRGKRHVAHGETLAAHRLELEITESVLLAETDNNLATLHRLRELGVRISLDISEPAIRV